MFLFFHFFFFSPFLNFLLIFIFKYLVFLFPFYLFIYFDLDSFFNFFFFNVHLFLRETEHVSEGEAERGHTESQGGSTLQQSPVEVLNS